MDSILIGEEASRLLASDSVKQAFENLERKYFEAWKSGKDTAEREAHFYRVEALAGLRAAINELAFSGRIDRESIKRKKESING